MGTEMQGSGCCRGNPRARRSWGKLHHPSMPNALWLLSSSAVQTWGWGSTAEPLGRGYQSSSVWLGLAAQHHPSVWLPAPGITAASLMRCDGLRQWARGLCALWGSPARWGTCMRGGAWQQSGDKAAVLDEK